jgi:hypothetical protein
LGKGLSKTANRQGSKNFFMKVAPQEPTWCSNMITEGKNYQKSVFTGKNLRVGISQFISVFPSEANQNKIILGAICTFH